MEIKITIFCKLEESDAPETLLHVKFSRPILTFWTRRSIWIGHLVLGARSKACLVAFPLTPAKTNCGIKNFVLFGFSFENILIELITYIGLYELIVFTEKFSNQFWSVSFHLLEYSWSKAPNWSRLPENNCDLSVWSISESFQRILPLNNERNVICKSNTSINCNS